MTNYYYNIENDEYTKAKMGMNAHSSTGYFNGYIDDFKIIKYEKGNKQNPPAINGPTIGKPNVEYDYSFITEDPEGDNISLYIDWGDGTVDEGVGPFKSGEEAIVSHKWDEEGTYGIKAKSKDIWDDGPWSDPYEVNIRNQAPESPTITGPKYGDPLQQLTYTFVSEDYEGDDVKYFIDWDDGTTTETSYHASGTPVTETHSWNENKDYYITARAIDIEGKEGDWSECHIRLGDQPPGKPDIYGPTSGVPEKEIDFVFSANDLENDQVWFDIKWGDGSEITDEGPYNSEESVTKSHTWNSTKAFKVEARARDNFGYYGDWESYSIKIPRNKALFNNLLELLIERYQNMFPLLRYLLNLQ
jgi:hypothetical protein